MDRTPPGVLQSHYHHLYMQQQQLRYYQELHQGAADHHALSRLQHLQRQDLLRGPVSPSCSSLGKRRKSVCPKNVELVHAKHRRPKS